MPKFRKKPVVIEAIQFKYTQEGIQLLRSFCGNKVRHISKERHPSSVARAEIVTLENGRDIKHIAIEGDWIVENVHGGFKPWRPDEFTKNFEPA